MTHGRDEPVVCGLPDAVADGGLKEASSFQFTIVELVQASDSDAIHRVLLPSQDSIHSQRECSATAMSVDSERAPASEFPECALGMPLVTASNVHVEHARL